MPEKQLTAEEKWEKATLANNFIFYKVMRHHQDACKRLIEILLGIRIEKMKMSNEEVIEIDYDSKGIRLDVFVKDTKKIYDIELQVTNTKELPERSRYYQGLMDLDTLKSGQKYKDLKDSHVIFICMEDVFDNELPVCTFENICIEDKITKLNDRAYKHFFIAPVCARIISDKEVKSFFELLISNTARTSFTSELKDYVSDAKHNMQWRVQFMTWERQRAYDFDDGKEAGIAIGAQQKAVEAAKNALSMNLTVEQTAKITGLPTEQVLQLKAQFCQKV
ncbi:MAG: Rpn family recombination-promoting nuclease/putative transposase [Treponema sp.]|nr:Rpn family recombination-promoting nuclease/putative transposase [Treponema sp.]